MNFSLVILLGFQFLLVFADKYGVLPPMYKMEDYVPCMDRNDLYCKADVRLRTLPNGDNTLSKLINDSINDKFIPDRSIIHRAICVPRKETDDLKSIIHFAETHITEELKGTSLIPYTEDIVCMTKDDNRSSNDIYFMILIVLYLFLVLYASVYDKRKRDLSSKSENIYDKILVSLSAVSNWRKLCKVDGNEDFNRLKSIQGIRFYTMLFLILLHTCLSYSIIYVSNPEEIEKILSYTFMKYVACLCTIAVQTFFMISSWIVTFQIYNIHRDYGKFTAKDAWTLFINRYFRVGVCSALMILLFQSSWYNILQGPNTFDIAVGNRNSCKQNWLPALFLIHNDSYFKDMCHPIAWYLSVDFQLYSATIITIYIILKFKLNEWKVISFLFLISCTVYGAIIYINEMDIILRVTPDFLRKHAFMKSDSAKVLYTSTYSSWGTSIIGIWLGTLYTKYRNRKVIKNKIMVSLWYIAFYGLPSLVILLAKNDFNGISAAVMGPLVKPLFCLGIGIGILGMSHNLGGTTKHICEHNYAVFLSNFCFSMYLFQLVVIFSKGSFSYSPIEFGLIPLAKSFLFRDVPLCLIVGIISALLFEQPGINIQKLFLPQLPRKKQEPQKEL